MVFDRVSYMCETLSNYSAQPAGAIREWCADKVAPKYWRPNHEIIVKFFRFFLFLFSVHFSLYKFHIYYVFF